jgi:hypothetical protein
LPLSLGAIQNSVINIKAGEPPFERVQDSQEYITYLKDLNLKGIRPKMYKKAINHKGESIGKHEVDDIKLNVIYEDGSQK